MDFILWGMVLHVAMKFLAPRAVTVYSIAREYSLGIAAPSPSTIVVPTTVSASPVLASIVLASESSCLASDFTSTLWFSPSATATTTSIPVVSPIDIPEPVTIEALAPGLSVTDSVCIAVILATITALLILCACLLGRVERPVALPEMSYSESIVAGTDYDWHKSDSLGSAGRFVDPETLLGIDILQWHDDKSVQDELKWPAREQAHQSKIATINDIRETRERRLRKELDASERRLQTELAAKESAHEARIAAREGSYQQQLDAIKAKHKKDLADMEKYANNQRRRLSKEAAMREEAEAKLKALVNATMLGSDQPKPTVQTQDVAQDAAPISTADQLPPVPVATKSSTVETEEVFPTEPASPASITEQASVEPTAETSPQDVAPGTGDQRPSTPAAAESPVTEAEVTLPAEPAPPATTPELASVEPTAETSPQDVAPGTGDQIPSPPAATASPFTEAEEESPVAIPSPLTEAEDEFPAATESPSEAESVLSSENGTEQEQEQEEEREHEQEQQEDKVEEEPHNSGMPLHEPSSMGEGAEQIPQHQEKGLALGAPVPTEETAATSQLTDLEAAPGAATSDDGASEAPVTTEVVPEEPTGDRATEEPMAVAESSEVHGTTSSDDGGLLEYEMPTTERSDQPPPALTGQGEPMEWQQSALANRSEDLVMDEAGESWPVSQPADAAADGSGDGMDTGDANGTGYAGLDDAVARVMNGQLIDLRGVDFSGESGNGTTNEPQALQADPANELQQDSDMSRDSQDGGLSGPGYESEDVPMEDAPFRILMRFGDTVVPRPFSFLAQSWRAQSGSDGSDGSSKGVVSTRLPILQQPPPSLPAQQPSSVQLSPPAQRGLAAQLPLPNLPLVLSPQPAQQLSSIQPSPPAHHGLAAQLPLPTQLPVLPPMPILQPTPQGPATPIAPPPRPLASTQPSGNNVATQGAQITQPPTSQLTPQPTLQTVTRLPANARAPGNPLIEESDPFIAANTINRWVIAANKAARGWMPDPEDGGQDADYFAKMDADGDMQSPLWSIRNNASRAADYLEYELFKRPESDSGDAMLCGMVLPAMENMRELYQELGVVKGCPDLSATVLRYIGFALETLREQKLEFDQRKEPRLSAPAAQPQPPALGVQSTQPPTSQPTPQTGTGQPQRIVLAELGNALQAAMYIRRWVLAANDKHGGWMSKDGAFFDDMRRNHDSEFSTIIGRIGEAAKWIEERETDKPKVESLLREIIPSVENMRERYKELGEVTKRQHLFLFLLRDVDRILKELKDIE